MKIRLLLSLFTLFPLLFGAAATATPLVITTNPILDDFLRQVAPPDTIRAHCLLAPGADPHANEPRPADLRLIAAADLIIQNGLNLEPALARLIRNSGTRAKILAATDGITPILDHHRAPDPHAWQDPQNAIRYIENIRDALIQLLPRQAAVITQRATDYIHQLRDLDQQTREKLSAIPPQNRVLVTTHDSLAYLARAYDLRVLPITGRGGCSHTEPNARQVAALIKTIREQKIPAIFIETTANPKLTRLIARETKTTLAPPLHTDTLPKNSTFLETYRQNIQTIATALGTTTP